MKRCASSFLLSLSTALVVGHNGPAAAGPWIDPGDVVLRNDIQLLADAGLIRAPVTTWPLSWGDIVQDIANNSGMSLGPGEKQALLRLRRAEQIATKTEQIKLRASASLSSEPRTLRTFRGTPRESAEVSVNAAWTGLRFTYRLQVTGVADPEDDRSARADGSYFGVVLGNYMLSFGQMDRWWGPGWEGSLILSTNARPIPAIALRRNFSEPFKTKWLRWMGPWTTSLVWGQLEGGRSVPNARFFGARLNFRPTVNLEIGLARTAQWCGSGRPCGLDTFTDLLLGQDNLGENTVLSDEPGNQLAGVDWRWRVPVRWPVAWYGQVIGEDEAGNLPSRMIGQLGVETWAYNRRFAGVMRGHLEFADTAAEFYKDQVRYDFAYRHNIYLDGYRYRDRSIGHAMDNDGRMISAGVTLDTDSGDQWRGLFRIVDLNRGGTEVNPVAASSLDLMNLELGYTRVLVGGELDIGIGVDRVEDWMTTKDETEFRAHITWQSDL
ncbi:MAG: capsule assembly Wzi family protein [Gammaproteobacteria bacterium]|nr:capsule assembly Wzi family protein [Gammaproteobacteria bacterium]